MLGRISAAALAAMASVAPQCGPAAPQPSTLDFALATSADPAAYVMGGMFVPTPGQNILDDIFNGYLQYNGILSINNVYALPTSEGFVAPAYQDDEAKLLTAVQSAPGGSTFVGYSESAGVLGMLLQDHPDAIKPGDHFVAFAPPTMPGSGQFTWAMDPQHFWSNWFKLGDNPTFPDTPGALPAGATVDVFCGEYDPYCNTLPPVDFSGPHPTNGWDYFWASLNSQAAAWMVHINYPSNGPAEYDHAVAITGPGFGDGTGAEHFWMTPDPDMHTLPLYAGLKLFDWLDFNLSVTLSNFARPFIDAAYANSPLYDAMMEVEHQAGVGVSSTAEAMSAAASDAAAAAGI